MSTEKKPDQINIGVRKAVYKRLKQVKKDREEQKGIFYSFSDIINELLDENYPLISHPISA